MKRFGILLDSGAILHLPSRSLKAARGHLHHWRATRRMAIQQRNAAPARGPDAMRPVVIPRRAIGLVIYKEGKSR